MSIKPLLIASLIFPASAMAEFSNTSYSFFGAGAEIVSYSEKLDNFGGQKVDSEFQVVNINQRSGGYTAVSDNFGFFIKTASTLIANEETEDWKAKGISGNIQEDTAAMNFQMLDISGAYHFGNGTYALAGIHYQKLSFSRFGWKNTPATTIFADAVENYLRNTPAEIAAIRSDIQKGNLVDRNGNRITTEDQYFAARRYNPEDTLDVVFEDYSTFSVTGGVEYDSYFVDQSIGMRYLLGGHIGLTVYENVLNSGHNEALTRDFGGGVDLRLTAGIGYQFRPEVGTLLLLEANGSWRDGIKERISESQTVELPDNTFYAYAINGTIFWNF